MESQGGETLQAVTDQFYKLNRGKAFYKQDLARFTYLERPTPEAPQGDHFMHNKKSRIVPFVFGIILGILCTIYLPTYAQPYLPESMVGKEIVANGTVTAKENKGNALLLTVRTPEGALLATFKKKADEVNLLVNEGDEIQVILPKHMPFIDDPKIIRVVKKQQAAPEPAPEAIPEEKSTKQVKPRRQEKPHVAAPDSGSATGMLPQALK